MIYFSLPLYDLEKVSRSNPETLDLVPTIENDISMLTSVKVWLSKEFSMKDLGEASFILGIKVYRDRPNRMLGFLQKMYIEEVLKRFSMENSKRGLLPFRHGIHILLDIVHRYINMELKETINKETTFNFIIFKKYTIVVFIKTYYIIILH